MSHPRGWTWGTHDDFVDVYHRYFLDAAYQRDDQIPVKCGRWKLMRSIAAQMRSRKSVHVLDCAAGTGFPSIDLLAETGPEFKVHCSDGDPAMVAVLEKRAANRGIDPGKLAPRYWPGPLRKSRSLILDWARLNQVEGRYDYVLCRGNSLAYADTWGGRRKVASRTLLETYLRRMRDKVAPGGYLHIDAPWDLGLSATSYRVIEGHSASIWEKVSVDRDAREWWMVVEQEGQRPVAFKRYSSLLTIDGVATILDRLGFEETQPFQLTGERSNFGVIIAKRPADR